MRLYTYAFNKVYSYDFEIIKKCLEELTDLVSVLTNVHHRKLQHKIWNHLKVINGSCRGEITYKKVCLTINDKI